MNNIDTAASTRALALSTTAFTVCFAVWTIFSIIGLQIKQNLNLSETQFGLLVGTPILTGSLSRLVLGILTDQYGGRIVYVSVMLSAAVATLLLSCATSYPMFLLAALGVGIAGGSFAVGVVYISRWYPQANLGFALGVFGMGNIGAAVTKFTAPFVMLALGWQAVAQIWAGALVLMAVIFWFATDDSPVHRARLEKNAPPVPFVKQLAPLKELRVWRLSLYYFFVFGAFVALALWLPRYLVGSYGFDIKTAGLLGSMYSIPASLFRVMGGWLSDRYGARTVMYLAFVVSAICTLILSCPPTHFLIHGIKNEVGFTLAISPVVFVTLTFILGVFMSFGKAAVYKLIPQHYPSRVGSVGGMVGMIGGLGGFFLPLIFGLLNDWTGIWTSCFMLLFVLVMILLLWMHFSILATEHQTPQSAELPLDLLERTQPTPVGLED